MKPPKLYEVSAKTLPDGIGVKPRSLRSKAEYLSGLYRIGRQSYVSEEQLAAILESCRAVWPLQFKEPTRIPEHDRVTPEQASIFDNALTVLRQEAAAEEAQD